MVLCFSQVGQGMNLYRYRMSQGGKMLLVHVVHVFQTGVVPTAQGFLNLPQRLKEKNLILHIFKNGSSNQRPIKT